MSYTRTPQSKLQFNTRQIFAGSILIGVGGAIALAGTALAGTALVSAFRQRVQQMEGDGVERAIGRPKQAGPRPIEQFDTGDLFDELFALVAR